MPWWAPNIKTLCILENFAFRQNSKFWQIENHWNNIHSVYIYIYLNPPRVWNLGPLITKNRPGGWNFTPLEGLGIYILHHITIIKVGFDLGDFSKVMLSQGYNSEDDDSDGDEGDGRLYTDLWTQKTVNAWILYTERYWKYLNIYISIFNNIYTCIYIKYTHQDIQGGLF